MRECISRAAGEPFCQHDVTFKKGDKSEDRNRVIEFRIVPAEDRNADGHGCIEENKSL